MESVFTDKLSLCTITMFLWSLHVTQVVALKRSKQCCDSTLGQFIYKYVTAHVKINMNIQWP